MTCLNGSKMEELRDGEVINRARRWYFDPALVAVARRHDAAVEPRYSAFAAAQINNFVTDTPPLVLDVGCGEGLISEMLESFRCYIGVDPDKAGIHMAESLTSSRVRFVRASVENIPPSVPRADVIVSSLSVALWDDPMRRCAELRKRLNPGGRIVIVDLLRTGPLLRYVSSDQRKQFLVDQYNVSLTREELQMLCDRALPGADISLFTDTGEAIGPAIENSSNFGNLFLVEFQES
ncbi:class I SAM-dependent methyltransferase [Corynebacterium timonense]